jgi:hypothetical protein
MARIKYGSLVTDIAGSIGGSTFQRSAYGNTLRSKPNPIRSVSSAQLNIRAFMKQAHQAWAAMSSNERQQWHQFTMFSNPSIKHDRNVHMSGHNLYIKYQVSRLTAGLAIQNTLQYISIPGWKYPDGFGIVAADALVIAVYGPAMSFNDVFAILKVSSPRPGSQSYNPHGLRYLSYVIEASINLTIYNSYLATFGFVPTESFYANVSYQVFHKDTPLFSNLYTKLYHFSWE